MMLIAKDIRKNYAQADTPIEVLKGIDIEIPEKERVSIVGPSGGGKSTLLSILAGVDRPTSGLIQIEGQDLSQLSEDEVTRFRGRKYGIIFQQFHLISHLTAVENVMLPLEILGEIDARERAEHFLNEVGLGHRLHHHPNQLSGGEAQRVAIARALVVRPKILLADEPSGNLDVKTGNQVMDLLFDLLDKYSSTLVLVTHSLELAQKCHRQYLLENGKLKVLA